MTPSVYVYTCVRTIGAGKATSASDHAFLRTYMEQEACRGFRDLVIILGVLGVKFRLRRVSGAGVQGWFSSFTAGEFKHNRLYASSRSCELF